MTRRLVQRQCVTLSLGLAVALIVSNSASATATARVRGTTSLVTPSAGRTGPRVRCVASSRSNDARATGMARAIDASLAGRASTVGLKVTDTGTGITCTYHASWHFYAA